MSKSLIIVRRELASYFSTWLGYIVMASALFINGLLFNAFAIGKSPKFSADVLSDYFYFASGMAIVAGLFLAMRLIAEERQNGTIVLFNTSPVTERQLIYGKFFSALFMMFILQVISLYMPALIFINGKISLGHLFSGYLVLILLGATAIAISLFASALSPNQLIAGIVGALITVTLLVLWMMSDVVASPFSEVFSYLAIHNKHFVPFSKGIVHIKDVIFYLSMVIFFLECSVRTLETKRWQG